MPDIDSDLRPDIKDVIMVYLKKKYGDRAIAQILTKSYLQGKSAIDKVVMILGSRDGRDYRYIAAKLKNKTGVDFLGKSMEENREALMAGADTPIEKEIVETAILMDQNLDHTGLHAAGVIISDNDDLAEYIPVAWDAGFQTWKTQCDMVQCEGKHGLLKMDLLLLKTLDIITYTLRLVEKTHPGVKIDIENLPLETEVFEGIYATGDTKSVFQFESGGMVKFLKQMKPTCIEDIIAANALYRPGPMDYIPDYVEAKHSGRVVYDCPELEPILKGTYGVIVYQEQVQRIVRDLAGYSLGRADLVRRAMSKKKMDVLAKERQNFVYGNKEENINGCINNGIKEDVANKIFDRMIEFAKYAFNKSHAAAYSVTSYATAWLKYYYAVEFYCAALTFTGAQKEIPSIIADAKKHGINVLRPDINKSEADFVPENGNIRFGLKFLANAKSRATSLIEQREGGFRSFKKFVEAKPGKQMAEACILSGACDSYCGNNPDLRNAMLEAYRELTDIYDKMISAKERIESATKDDVREKAKAAYEEATKQYEAYNGLPDVAPMTLMERLENEQKYTSVYFSGDPLDSYEIDEKKYSTIDDLEDGKNVWIAAALSDKTDLKTKKDAAPMMSGKLTDRTGTVDMIIFPKVFEKVSDKIETVMAWQGRLQANDEEEPQFVVSDVKVLPQKTRRIIVWFDNYQATKDAVKAGNVPRTQGMETWLGGKNSKLYATGCYIPEEYAKKNGWKYTIE